MLRQCGGTLGLFCCHLGGEAGRFAWF